MEFKILKQQKNPLLMREEYFIEIASDVTPTFKDVKDFLKQDELAVVKLIKGSFGRYNFKADVLVYDSKEAKDKIEVVPRKIKKKMEEERRKEEEKRKAEEAKAQESKQEGQSSA